MFLGKPADLSDREPDSCELVRVVSDVIDVLVSLSSVVTELCDIPPCCSDGEFGTAILFFLSKACTLLYTHAGRDEVRRLTSDSASDFKKKDDATYT